VQVRSARQADARVHDTGRHSAMDAVRADLVGWFADRLASGEFRASLFGAS